MTLPQAFGQLTRQQRRALRAAATPLRATVLLAAVARLTPTAAAPGTAPTNGPVTVRAPRAASLRGLRHHAAYARFPRDPDAEYEQEHLPTFAPVRSPRRERPSPKRFPTRYPERQAKGGRVRRTHR